MHTGAINSYFDVAQLVLYGFWIFFFGLIYHIRKEDKREGFPLVSDLPGRIRLDEAGPMPMPKTFLLHDGTTVMAPRHEAPAAEPKAVPSGSWPGAPLDPTGDSMIDGVGPASWVNRSDKPDVVWETGQPRIVPLRVDLSFGIPSEDPDPRGMTVIGCDEQAAGTVVDAWVDRSETVLRFLEVEIPDGRHVLVPLAMARVRGGSRTVKVRSITSVQFANVPQIKNPEQITRLEEDKIYGYFAGGTLYATADRMEPLL